MIYFARILIAFQVNNQHLAAIAIAEQCTDQLQTFNKLTTIKIVGNEKIPLPSTIPTEWYWNYTSRQISQLVNFFIFTDFRSGNIAPQTSKIDKVSIVVNKKEPIIAPQKTKIVEVISSNAVPVHGGKKEDPTIAPKTSKIVKVNSSASVLVNSDKKKEPGESSQFSLQSMKEKQWSCFAEKLKTETVSSITSQPTLKSLPQKRQFIKIPSDWKLVPLPLGKIKNIPSQKLVSAAPKIDHAILNIKSNGKLRKLFYSLKREVNLFIIYRFRCL